MTDFDLDLGSIEQDELDIPERQRITLGILDGDTPTEDWLSEIAQGNVLILDIEGDLNELASGFAREVKDAGGSLVHFRGFLVVAPGSVDIDFERL